MVQLSSCRPSCANAEYEFAIQLFKHVDPLISRRDKSSLSLATTPLNISTKNRKTTRATVKSRTNAK